MLPHSFHPFHLATFLLLEQIRCTDTLTQNVVIDVFDEVITLLHKGQGDSGYESQKVYSRGSGLHAGVYFLVTSS